MCLRLNHTPTHTQPETSDIPTNPETFPFLTSSYHTLSLRFDLLFKARYSSALSCGIPYVHTGLWACLFPRACDEFRTFPYARYLKHLSLRCGILHRAFELLLLTGRMKIQEFSYEHNANVSTLSAHVPTQAKQKHHNTYMHQGISIE